MKPAIARVLLHERKITKKEASRSISAWSERNDRDGVANIPVTCPGCGDLFWRDTMIPMGLYELKCSGCALNGR